MFISHLGHDTKKIGSTVIVSKGITLYTLCTVIAVTKTFHYHCKAETLHYPNHKLSYMLQRFRLFIYSFSKPWSHTKVKAKVSFYIAQYPVRWTAKSALHFTPWQTCSFRHQLDFSGKHSSDPAIRHEDYSLTFPPLSITKYSFIQLSEQKERTWKERKCTNFETVAKGDSDPGSLDSESGILRLSYRASKSLICTFIYLLVFLEPKSVLICAWVYKVTGKRRSTTIAATPDDGKSQRKRRWVYKVRCSNSKRRILTSARSPTSPC